MADSTIVFKLKSAFSGEGFTAAQNAAKGMSGTVNRTASAMGKLNSALGESNSALGKCVGAVGSVAGAFAQGGIAGAAFTLAMTAINFVVEEQMKKFEELKKRAADFAAELEKTASSAISDRMNNLTSEIKGMTDQFNRTTKLAIDFSNAMEGLRSSGAGASLINLEVEKFNEMLSATSEAEKQNIEATYEVEKAKLREKDTLERARHKIDVASTTRANAEDNIAMIDGQLAKVLNDRKVQEVNFANADGAVKDAAKKALTDLTAKEVELKAKRQELIDSIKVLKIKEETAINDYTNAVSASALSVQEAENKRKEVERKARIAESKKAVAEEVAALELERAKSLREQSSATERERINAEYDLKIAQAKAKEETDDAVQKLAQKTAVEQALMKAEDEQRKKAEEALKIDLVSSNKELDAANKELAKAEKDYAEKLKAFNENYASSAIDEAVFGFKGKAMKVSVINKVAADVADHEVRRLLDEGVIAEKDADRYRRMYDRDTRTRIEKRYAETRLDALRFGNLLDQNDKHRSVAEQQFIDGINSVMSEGSRQRQELEESKTALQNTRDVAKITGAHVAEIVQKISQLGLK